MNVKSESSNIIIWNREKKELETEKVYGDAAVKWLYTQANGQKLADSFLSGKLLSKIYGAYQSSALSIRKILPFIHDFKIPMGEYLEENYTSFNDFFIRQFRPEMRTFDVNPGVMPAFAEARYLGFSEILPEQLFPVKGKFLSESALLEKTEWAQTFARGPLLLARLCPVDYHRFHFPDSGRILAHFRVKGRLHSVNPLALQYRSDIFATNERRVTILETENFGKLAYIEVGAMGVGKIVQGNWEKEWKKTGSATFKRGDEKGYFLFGGSTVIVLGEPRRWRPSQDLLDQTMNYKRESLVKLGQPVAEVL